MTRRFFKYLVLSLAGLLVAQNSLRADAPGAVPVKSAVLEGNVAYLEVSQVGTNLVDEIRVAQTALAASNKIAGTVLDLRFADGSDTNSAKALADLFAATQRPLAILVNGQTRGAAAALAAELRKHRAGLIFGGATAPTHPDIVVATNPDNERAFMENSYAEPVPDGTNAPTNTNSLLPFVDHTSEADLVRAKIKDGGEFEPASAGRASEPSKPFIRDPVLARAVDLIKGLAIVRLSHS